jgi:hypothetical protein
VNAFDERMQVCVGDTPTKFGVAAQGEQREGISDTNSITDNPPSVVSNPVNNQTEATQHIDCIGTVESETTENLVPSSAHFKAVVTSSRDNEDERFG